MKPLSLLIDAAASIISVLDDVFDALRLRHFQRAELASEPHQMPPPHLIPNMVPTLILADEARARFGAPLRINSAYRTVDYNAQVGGSPRSQHLANRALDLAPLNGHVRNLALIFHEMRGEWFQLPVFDGFDHEPKDAVCPCVPIPMKRIDGVWHFQFLGGIGIYPSFVHVDTRGINLDWER